MRKFKNVLGVFLSFMLLGLVTACKAEETVITKTNADSQSLEIIQSDDIHTETNDIIYMTSNWLSSAGTTETAVENIKTVDTTVLASIINTYVKQGNRYYPSVAFADLNNDGVCELFITSYENAGCDGFTDIYDMTFADVAPLAKLHLKAAVDTGALYKDIAGNIHYIVHDNWWSSSDNYYNAYYDVTYDEVTVPFCAIPNTWYDNGEYKCNYSVYVNATYDDAIGYKWQNYGFGLSSAIKQGEFDSLDENSEIDTIVQKSVYADLEYYSEIEESKATTWEEITDVITAYYNTHYNIKD